MMKENQLIQNTIDFVKKNSNMPREDTIGSTLNVFLIPQNYY